MGDVMKERYFCRETLEKKALAMLSNPEIYRRPYEIKREGVALLILDMQKYFLESTSHAYVPSAPAIIPKIKALMSSFLNNRLPVILTRHVNTEEDAGFMKRWWREIIIEENPRSEIIPELVMPDSLVLKKSQYDAFYNTPLESILKEEGVEQVVVTGVMTHLCCETTARAAAVRGFEVFFPVDATATYKESFHRATLLNLSHGFAHAIMSDDIINSLRGMDEGE